MQEPQTKQTVLVLQAMENFDLHNRFSAVSSVLFSLAELLQDGGYDVWVNNLSMKEELIKSRSSSQDYSFQASSSGLIARLLPKKIKAYIKQWLNFKRLDRFPELLSSNPRADVIIEFQSHASNVGAQLSKSWSAPLLYIYDAPQVEEYKFLHGHYPPFAGRVAKAETTSLMAATKIMAYSPAVSDSISASLKVKKDFFYHQLADFKRFKTFTVKNAEGRIVLGYIGSFLRWHNLEILLAVFQRLRYENYDVGLSLIGIGLEFDRIQALASSLTHGAEIEFHGYCDGKKLEALIQKMHIGIIPNALWFHGPVKLFQYGASGLLTLAADTPTISFIAERNPGIRLFKTNSEQDLYTKLKNLLDNREQLEKFSKLNQENTLDQYSPQSSKNVQSGD